MSLDPRQLIIATTGANQCENDVVLQPLWSSYGSITRWSLDGTEMKSVIAKHVAPPTASKHPRGWDTDRSHMRKLKSYEVESAWYENHAKKCGEKSRVPECFAVHREGDEVLLILEDLDAAGFPHRSQSVTESELHACIKWLANFHATFLNTNMPDLWESGTYWHLETRPDEMKILSSEDPELWEAAEAIDAKLKSSPYQTIVHGDAKLTNFCFSTNGQEVAAVDFQYVGHGCGMKDVAYFIGSCFGDDDCAYHAPKLLEVYFEELMAAIAECNVDVDMTALENDWRALYPVAWTDFHRFLKGWSPGHWKIHSYSERLARETIANL